MGQEARSALGLAVEPRPLPPGSFSFLEPEEPQACA